jgi:hypothetical protein
VCSKENCDLIDDIFPVLLLGFGGINRLNFVPFRVERLEYFPEFGAGLGLVLLLAGLLFSTSELFS